MNEISIDKPRTFGRRPMACALKHALQVAALLAAAISVPAQVRYTPPFEMPEFSACFSRPADGEAFWTGSDERRAPDVSPRDIIWKVDFASGAVVGTNLNVVELNDIEGLAADTNGGFFVVTSQSLSIDGTFGSDSNRLRLAHYDATGGLDAVKYNLRGSMEGSFPFLTNYWAMLPKFGGLDVEGLAYEPPANRLWVGLRGPLVNPTNPALPGGHAVLLAMTNVLTGASFNAGSFGWDPTPRFLDLGGEGLRDLFYNAATTNLLLLTGKLPGNDPVLDGQGGAFTNTQACHVLAYAPAGGPLAFCLRLPQVPNMPSNATAMSEAEGICAITLGGVRKLLVTYDSKSNGVYQALAFPTPSTFAHPDGGEGFLGL